MRRYLLDTAPLASLRLARPAAVDLISPWLNRHEVATSILAYSEVVEYIRDFADAGRRPHGKGLIGDIDTLIAATALERTLTVVTYDRDFQRVPDLKVILLSPTTMNVLSAP
jgi:predicted nucleic acid-binding protein